MNLPRQAIRQQQRGGVRQTQQKSASLVHACAPLAAFPSHYQSPPTFPRRGEWLAILGSLDFPGACFPSLPSEAGAGFPWWCQLYLVRFFTLYAPRTFAHWPAPASHFWARHHIRRLLELCGNCGRLLCWCGWLAGLSSLNHTCLPASGRLLPCPEEVCTRQQ